MDVGQLSEQDRATFLESFQLYRVGEQSDVQYRHRDSLEAKLQSGKGILNEVELTLMKGGIALYVSDATHFHYLMGLLPD